MKKAMILAIAALMCSNPMYADDVQINYTQNQSGEHELFCDIAAPVIKTVTAGSGTYQTVTFGSGVHTRLKGYAEMPFVTASVMLSPKNDVRLEFTGGDYAEYTLEHPLLPSRGVIYRNQNPDEIPYMTDPNSVTDSWYPSVLAETSEPYIIRDVRGVTVKIFPFQYNAKLRILRAYRTIRVRLTEHMQTSTNPLTRVPERILREMDAVYRSVFINYSGNKESLTIGEDGGLLVITTARDTAAIEPYIQWKKEKGMDVLREIVPVNTNVKSLIQQKYNENPDLLYVQLVGDWADIRSDLGTSSDFPMDPQLGCVAGTDFIADLCIGRFSAATSADVTVQVNKTIGYEKTPDSSGAWYPRALGIASEEGPGDDNEIDYEHIGNIYNRKLHPFTYAHYDSVYEPNDYASYVTSSVNEGVSVINYTGHGSSSSWGTTGFNNANVNALSNGSKMPFIISVACNNGQFHNTTCFGETWLRKDQGGAVLMLASTISQPWDPPMRGQDYINDILTGGYDYSLYPGQNGITNDEQRVTAGSLIFNALTLMYTESNQSDDLETMQTWTIFGDVTLMLRTDTPREIYLTNEQILTGVPFTTTVMSGSPAEGATISLIQDGNFFRGITGSSGSVTIDHGLMPGPVRLVVTGFNTTTIYADLTVSSPDGPWITAELKSVADDSGNGNGQADFGETLHLNVAANNVGLDSASGVTAVLSTADTFITVNDSQFAYGKILADSSVPGETAFQITVHPLVPDMHPAKCTVTFTDDSGRAWQSQIIIPLHAPSFSAQSLSVDDAVTGDHDGILDPGETAELVIPVVNRGHSTAGYTAGWIYTTSSSLILITDSCYADSVSPGDTVMLRFTVSADSLAVPGTPADIGFFTQFQSYTAQKDFSVVIGIIPEYRMKNGIETVSNGKFYDTGGQTGKYQNNENFILTLSPLDNTRKVRISFASFSIEEDWDYLYVYDGPDTNSPQVSGSPFTGTSITQVITSGHASGALTFRFYSDVYLTDDGWEAGISCVSLVTADEREETAPKQFELSQNYPNPFNPSTAVRYSVPSDGKVTLKVYNVLGQEVATLVNGHQKAGHYTVNWNGKDMNGRAAGSGIYLYRIQAGQRTAVRKMMLLK